MAPKGFSSEKFLVLTVIWMFLGIGAIAYFLNYVYEKSENMPNEVELAANSLKKLLPIDYGEGVQLISVSSDTSTLIMVMEIDGRQDTELLEIFAADPTAEDYEDVCTSSEQMKGLLMFGAAIRIQYISHDGQSLNQIEANKQTCEPFHQPT
ncbi:hypothetical protein QTP81_16970 [Alteromonas sp. ASW11-36]|uniref:Histidine kinase n=1 Tax=Alteromonas arenosi TaxID=3055817 RepID=A0ABT7T1J8_9ALTE|nr:hypothetical protein [Alteromonas sp. ASW11-36]MDM7862302.1 hypothetical protein [Alteromonas sp. ASW11-36]